MTGVEQAINSDLRKINKWYEENEMRRNHDKYKAMIMGPYFQGSIRAFGCNGR